MSELPSHHSVTYVRVEPSTQYVPLIILADGAISRSALLFGKHLLAKGYRTAAVHAHMKAIGLFYDVLHATRLQTGLPATAAHLTSLLQDFMEARRFGTQSPDGNDLLSLHWSPDASGAPYSELLKLLHFCAYCSAQLVTDGSEHSLDLIAEVFTGNSGLAALRGTGADRYRMLSHLAPKKTGGLLFQRKREPNDRARPRSFPAHRIPDLLQRTANVRDRLLWILGAFGATRLSECLNLYATDISWRVKQGTHVLLAHPQLARIAWVDSYGRQKKGTREEYLKSQYSAVPRNSLPISHPQYAGWKGMVYGTVENDEDYWRGQYHADIFWLLPQAGELFWQLHEQYEKLRIVLMGNHPYYFISLQGPSRGEPITIKNVQQIFQRVCRKLGVKTDFYHSLRHFYGHSALNVLQKMGKDGRLQDLSIIEVRAMMRHRSEESTRIYAQPDLARIKDELQKIKKPPDKLYSGLFDALSSLN